MTFHCWFSVIFNFFYNQPDLTKEAVWIYRHSLCDVTCSQARVSFWAALKTLRKPFRNFGYIQVYASSYPVGPPHSKILSSDALPGALYPPPYKGKVQVCVSDILWYANSKREVQIFNRWIYKCRSTHKVTKCEVSLWLPVLLQETWRRGAGGWSLQGVRE